MGLPYSKQINAAFDQVTPLVAAGFEVLRTTKNISILLAAIQVLTVILLALILMILFAIVITLDPDLDKERQALVTPTVKWFASILLRLSEYSRTLTVLAWVVIIGGCIGSTAGLYYTSRDPTLAIEESFDDDDATKTDDVEAK